ncbi:uncharacterized protein TEOVI_000107000 [Trypanosoma equiperdum]|uniref:Trypanosoma vivax n=1 Tax=Trypanosoma equiperdum TaxID=5694 RepID=A0A1G4IBD5_TRYEQ|nr:hypothetical protein TEOVI_000107000 [Trypanosoma equiperdum]
MCIACCSSIFFTIVVGWVAAGPPTFSSIFAAAASAAVSLAVFIVVFSRLASIVFVAPDSSAASRFCCSVCAQLALLYRLSSCTASYKSPSSWLALALPPAAMSVIPLIVMLDGVAEAAVVTVISPPAKECPAADWKTSVAALAALPLWKSLHVAAALLLLASPWLTCAKPLSVKSVLLYSALFGV